MLVTITEIHSAGGEKEPPPHKIRLGVHCRPVLVGNSDRCDYRIGKPATEEGPLEIVLSPEGDRWVLAGEYLLVAGRRVGAVVALEPDLEALILHPPDVFAYLRVDAAPDSDPEEGPVKRLQEEVAALRREVIRGDEKCEQRLIGLQGELEELKAAGTGQESLVLKLESDLNSLMDLFNRRFDELGAHIANAEADLKTNKGYDALRDERIIAAENRQNRTIAVLAISLVACGGWIVTNGNMAAMEKYLPWVATALGLGSAGQLAAQQMNRGPERWPSKSTNGRASRL